MPFFESTVKDPFEKKKYSTVTNSNIKLPFSFCASEPYI